MVLSMPKTGNSKKNESAPSGAAKAAITALPARSTRRIDSIESLGLCLAAAEAFRIRYNRPFITVSYAQSVDGSIATKSRQPISLSGPGSAELTHQIRACSDAILIGIGTLLADDPRLNVRLVEGSSPQPIILDTHLRTPLTARIVNRSDTSPWIINAKKNRDKRAIALKNAGSTPIGCASRNGKIDLDALMEILVERRINSVMVEGGARVITSFVNSRLVDQFIVTVSPKFVGGLQVIESDGWQTKTHLDLAEVSYRNIGDDLIIWARPSRPG